MRKALLFGLIACAATALMATPAAAGGPGPPDVEPQSGPPGTVFTVSTPSQGKVFTCADGPSVTATFTGPNGENLGTVNTTSSSFQWSVQFTAPDLPPGSVITISVSCQNNDAPNTLTYPDAFFTVTAGPEPPQSPPETNAPEATAPAAEPVTGAARFTG